VSVRIKRLEDLDMPVSGSLAQIMNDVFDLHMCKMTGAQQMSTDS